MIRVEKTDTIRCRQVSCSAAAPAENYMRYKLVHNINPRSEPLRLSLNASVNTALVFVWTVSRETNSAACLTRYCRRRKPSLCHVQSFTREPPVLLARMEDGVIVGTDGNLAGGEEGDRQIFRALSELGLFRLSGSMRVGVDPRFRFSMVGC
jgi:hypothetical protein